MRGRALAVFALAAACGGSEKPRRAAPPKRLTPAEIARRTLPSVVGIQTDRALGTGFVIDADGLIATNFHLVKGARRATITTADERTFTEVRVAAFDQAHDLAILRIPARGLRPLRFQRGELEIGQPVVAIGNPIGLTNTVSDGLVSAVRRIGPGLELIQISAPISSGSSGGPVLDDRGRVIGVATLQGREGQNLNFAVPISYLATLVEERGEEIPLSALPDDSARRYFKGCSAADIVTIHVALEQARRKGLELGKKGRHKAALEHYRLSAADLILRIPRCGLPRHDLLRAAAKAERATRDDIAASELHRMMNGIAAELKKALR